MKKLFLSILITTTAAMILSLSASGQCNFILPAGTIILDHDTTMAAAYPDETYLLCPGVDLIYNDNSHFERFFLEPGATMSLSGYGYSKVFVKSGATFDANSIQYDSLYYETGSVLLDTAGPGFRYKVFCSSIVFGYALLPGGVGCPGVGINSPESNRHLMISPNPAFDELIIEEKGNSKSINFEILNSLGQIVSRGSLVEKTIVLVSNFAPGIYFLKLENAGTYKFVKE